MEYEINGYITVEELRNTVTLPSMERMRKGPVAVPECPQRIPCSPCMDICPSGAITMENINDIPVVNYDKCIGCGLCVQICPGLAIFMVGYINGKATVTMPYEFIPVPEINEKVILHDRKGEKVGFGTVKSVLSSENVGNTTVITVEIPKELIWDTRHISRINATEDDRKTRGDDGK